MCKKRFLKLSTIICKMLRVDGWGNYLDLAGGGGLGSYIIGVTGSQPHLLLLRGEGGWREVWDTAHRSCVCCRTVRPFAGCHGVGDRRIAVFTLKLVHKRTADHRHSPPAGPWANPTAHLCWKWLRNLLPVQGQAKFSNKLKNLPHS